MDTRLYVQILRWAFKKFSHSTIQLFRMYHHMTEMLAHNFSSVVLAAKPLYYRFTLNQLKIKLCLQAPHQNMSNPFHGNPRISLTGTHLSKVMVIDFPHKHCIDLSVNQAHMKT